MPNLSCNFLLANKDILLHQDQDQDMVVDRSNISVHAQGSDIPSFEQQDGQKVRNLIQLQDIFEASSPEVLQILLECSHNFELFDNYNWMSKQQVTEAVEKQVYRTMKELQFHMSQRKAFQLVQSFILSSSQLV